MSLLLVLLLIDGCSGPGSTTDKKPESATPIRLELDEPANPATPESARSAAMIVASLPPVRDPRASQEIVLHAALYRAAYESNVGGFKHFLLEPLPMDHQANAGAPALRIDEREFALRVIAELADLNVPMAWSRPGRFDGAVEWFPNTRERATRLRIRIKDRIDEQATVLADVGDWTADYGSSRQAVTAVWDGQAWAIQRDRVRLVW